MLEDIVRSLGEILLYEDLKDYPQVLNRKSKVGCPTPHHWLYGLSLVLAAEIIKLIKLAENVAAFAGRR